MGELVEFASNGGRASGYLATPVGEGPGVVVIQEWWGLVPHIEDVCDRLAAEGFVALAPDLYHGEPTTEPDEAGKKMMALSMEQAAKDMSGAVDKVAETSGRQGVGVIGFCMGGGLALLLGTLRPDRVKAVVPFYGVIPWPAAQPDFSKLDGAVQGHYADHDDFADPESVRALERTLRDLGKQAELFIYPGTQHAFFNDTRPEVHDTDASRQAWARAVGFLHAQLG
jgi:carboxymethylenebutenolidase